MEQVRHEADAVVGGVPPTALGIVGGDDGGGEAEGDTVVVALEVSADFFPSGTMKLIASEPTDIPCPSHGKRDGGNEQIA